MSIIKNYFSLIKFSHTIFALPFACIGLLLGFQSPNFHFDYKIVILVLLCMIFARSAAMAFNRWVDIDIDIHNPRTANREIPSGIIPPRSALSFTIINCILFIITTWFINRLCFYLSPIALLIILGYSYTKRFTSLCHLILGLGLSLAPIGSYIAVTGKFAFLPLFFSFAVICWVSGFDIIYALQDDDFDKANQLFSIPASLGRKRALRISEYLHLFSALFLLYAAIYGSFGPAAYCGLGIFIALLIYQHTLVKIHNLSRVNLAFFTTNGIASILFAAFIFIDRLL